MIIGKMWAIQVLFQSTFILEMKDVTLSNMQSLEQLTETENVNKAILKFRLKQKENSWILKVDTLALKDLYI